MTPWSKLESYARQYGQAHLVDHATRLAGAQHESFLQELHEIDFSLMRRLFNKSKEAETPVDLSKLVIPPIYRAPKTSDEQRRFRDAKARGEAALREGKIA